MPRVDFYRLTRDPVERVLAVRCQPVEVLRAVVEDAGWTFEDGGATPLKD